MCLQRGNARHWRDVRGGKFEPSGKTRTYYLQAEEILWDYAPMGYNAISGQPFSEDDEVFVGAGGPFVGSKYLKVRTTLHMHVQIAQSGVHEGFPVRKSKASATLPYVLYEHTECATVSDRRSCAYCEVPALALPRLAVTLRKCACSASTELTTTTRSQSASHTTPSWACLAP